MTEQEFKEVCSEIFEEKRKDIETTIEHAKKCVDDYNENIKKYNRAEKPKGYRYFPGHAFGRSSMEYLEFTGAKNLQELMDDKEKFILYQVYVEFLYGDNRSFKNRLAATKAKSGVKGRIVADLCLCLIGGSLVGGIFSLIFPVLKFWGVVGGAILGALLFTAQIKTFPKWIAEAKVAKAEYRKLQEGEEYVRQSVSKLIGFEKDRYERILSHQQMCLRQIEKYEKDIKRSRAETIRIATSKNASNSVLSSSSSSNGSYFSSDSASERVEVTDQYGKTQGYVQDGRIYNDKSDIVGYVDEYNRVYDKDSRRIGEVEKDGKIKKYK